MNLRKNKMPRSIRSKLLISSNILFITFSIIFAIVSSLIYSISMSKESVSQIDNITQQVLRNYETYFNSIIATSNDVQVKIDNEELMIVENSSVKQYFDIVMGIKKEIKNISIYNLSGNFLVGNSSCLKNNVNPETERWFYQAKNESMIHIFSRVDKINSSNYSFTFSKRVKFNKRNDEGILKVEYDFGQIVGLISQTDLGEGGHITIYDRDFEVVYSSKDNISNNEMQLVKNLLIGQKKYIEDNIAYVLNIYTIVNTTWKVAIIYNNNAIKETIFINLSTTIIISILASIVYVFVLVKISNSLTQPIVKLQQEMQNVENLNYELTLSNNIKPTSKEVMELNNNFNQMMTRIKELMKKVLDEQDSKRKLELKALQNQINPHFLYNTLDSIIYLIDQNENQKASQMIIALSKFFRISISRGKNIITIEKEIEHAQNYLIIQKMRYEDTFEYSLNIDNSILQYPILKLILQPIIENALAYGLRSETDFVNKIEIEGKTDGYFIYFIIKDNGLGMPDSKIEEIYFSFSHKDVNNGVGLKNIYQRLIIFYGPEADIKITSELDEGTTVEIIIPIKENLKYED